MSWPELRRQVASCALALRALGVQRGDRVAAYLPNVPETMVAFLACSSIGAVWSVCAPDMGTAAVVDRFRQIEPQAADRGRRRALRRQGAGPQRGGAGTARRAAQRAEAAAASHALRGAADPGRGRVERRRRARRRRDRGLRARMAALRPSDLDRLFERHHRPAQAHRARAGRHPADDVRLRPAPRPGPELRRQQLRRALPLVQLDRLGDVELAALGPGLRHDHLHLRRQSGRQQGEARLGRAVALRGAAQGHFLRRRRGLLLQLHEGRARGQGLRRPLARARARQHRLAAVRGGAALGHGAAARGRRARGVVVQHFGRHRFLRRLRRRQPRAARGAGADAVPLPRRCGRGLERAGPAGDRRGRRTGVHEADPVDAAVLLGRRRQRALPVELLRHLSRASGATATGS